MTTFAASVTIVDLPVGTTVSGAELFEAVQTSSGVGQSVQLTLTQMLSGTGTIGSTALAVGSVTATAIATATIGTAQIVTGAIGMTLIGTLSPNGVSSASFTSLPSTFRDFVVEFDNVCPATQTTTLQMQVATSGVAFISSGYVAQSMVNVGATVVVDVSSTALIMTGIRATTQVQTTLSYGASGWIKIYHPSGTTNRVQVLGQVSYVAPGTVSTSTLCQSRFNGFQNDGNSAVTGINFLFNSGNIQTGVFKLYGLY